ncbi:MAG: von Willebrand factor type A domain-containing protein [Planctomycetaceae bacterium]|nr:von Willebrand factor type A domain-containing protein [Planctomycetaceae bacterium]
MNEKTHNHSIEPELEARIVALVLGEASDFETEELERLMEARPELAAFRQEMEEVSSLLREVGGCEEMPGLDWSLPAERRQVVLDAMQGKVATAANDASEVVTSESSTLRRRRRVSFVEVMVATAILAVVIGLFIPPVQMARESARRLAKTESRAYESGLTESWDIAPASELMPKSAAAEGADATYEFDLGFEGRKSEVSDVKSEPNATSVLSQIQDSLSFQTPSSDSASNRYSQLETYRAPVTNAPSRSIALFDAPQAATNSTDTNGPVSMNTWGAITNGISNLSSDALVVPEPAVDPLLAAQPEFEMHFGRPTVSSGGVTPPVSGPEVASAKPGSVENMESKPTGEVALGLPALEWYENGRQQGLQTAPAPADKSSPNIAGLAPSDRIEVAGGTPAAPLLPGQPPDGFADNQDSPKSLDTPTIGGFAPQPSDPGNATLGDDAKDSIKGRDTSGLVSRGGTAGVVDFDATIAPPGGPANGGSGPTGSGGMGGGGQGVGSPLEGDVFFRQTGQWPDGYLQDQPSTGGKEIAAAEQAEQGQVAPAKLKAPAPGSEFDRSQNQNGEVERLAEVADEFARNESRNKMIEKEGRSNNELLRKKHDRGSSLEEQKQESVEEKKLAEDLALQSQAGPDVTRGFIVEEEKRQLESEVDSEKRLDFVDSEQSLQEGQGRDDAKKDMGVAEKEDDKLRGLELSKTEDAVERESLLGKSSRGRFQSIAPTAGLNETNATSEPFSTFSLHVSDVSFKLALDALARGQWPEAAKIRIEEFVNAFDYGDPLPSSNNKVACVVEQAIHPFIQQRNILRVSMRTSAEGRAQSTPLRLTLVLDNSGSMERLDRQQAVRRALSLLAQHLSPHDQVTLISFARQPRLLAENLLGSAAGQLVELLGQLPSEGGTNIEAALKLAFEKANAQQAPGVQNRIVLLTDGAVNLGNADPESLSKMVESMRAAGIAFDAAGISAEGLNDEVLEALTRKGDGRYYLLDGEESSGGRFAQQIAGALRPSASNVKVQIEFNPQRVGQYKLLGFEKHILQQEDFRNDAVDAAEMAAAEAGVAVYQFEPKPDGAGDIGSVSVRFRDLANGQMIEQRWPIPYEANPSRPDQASTSIRLATAAALLAARLRGEALGETVDLKTLSDLVTSLPEQQQLNPRVQELKLMIEQARQLSQQ